jgi:hypothetical protein
MATVRERFIEARLQELAEYPHSVETGFGLSDRSIQDELRVYER